MTSLEKKMLDAISANEYKQMTGVNMIEAAKDCAKVALINGIDLQIDALKYVCDHYITMQQDERSVRDLIKHLRGKMNQLKKEHKTKNQLA